MLNQFMGIGNHSIVKCVTTIFLKKVAWENMLHQFMRERNHSSVKFVTNYLLKRQVWLDMLPPFMRKYEDCRWKIWIVRIQVEIKWISIHFQNFQIITETKRVNLAMAIFQVTEVSKLFCSFLHPNHKFYLHLNCFNLSDLIAIWL